MESLSLGVAEWLCSSTGLEIVAQSTARLDEGVDELRLGTWLRRARGLEAEHATAAVAAASARRRARERWPDADRMLFTPTALEQASDPEVSAWRARRLAHHPVWDLCAGIGGDSLAIAATAGPVTAVDLDPARLRLLEHNAGVLGVDVTTLRGDALEVRPPAGSWIHADPSRRRDGRRVRRLVDHQPPVDALLAHHLRDTGTVAMGLVLSPAVDLDDPALPADAELEFVADAHALRESVAWLRAARSPGVVASATLLPAGERRVRRTPPPSLPVGPVGSHLVEVVPAAVRARLHAQIGLELGARRLAERRALLTVDGAPPPSPWYRVHPVLAVLPAREKAVRRWLRDHDGVPVELVTHGLSADPERWWRGLGRPARGPRGYRIELVRTDGGARAVVTDSRQGPSGTLPS